MNCKDTVEIWEVTLSLFLLFSNHFAVLRLACGLKTNCENCACSAVSCRFHGKLHHRESTLRHMGTEVVQGLQHKHHIKLLLTPGSKHTTGQRSRGRPVDSSEKRRYLLIRKDHDACTRKRIPRGFFIFFYCKRKGNKSLPIVLLSLLHLGSCNACLLQSHFSISSWQCCR